MYAILIITGFLVLSFLTVRGIIRRRMMSFSELGRGMMVPGNIVTGPLAIVYGIVIEIGLVLLALGLLISLSDFSNQNNTYYINIILISITLALLIIYILNKYGK